MPDDLPHLFVEGRFQTGKYTYAGQPPAREVRLPVRDRTAHATTIREQLNQAREENERQRGVATPPKEPAPIILEIRSEPGFGLKLDSVEDRRKGIEVACVRTDGDIQVATVHVPEGSLTHVLKRVEEYLTEDTTGTAKTPAHPRNQELIETIAQLRLATLRSFWTDEGVEFPPEDRPTWWEIWLRASGEQSPWDTFRLLAEVKGLRIGTETIRFPDRLVGLAFGTATQLSSSVEILDMMAELRKAKENPAAFIGLKPKEQAEWVESFLPRLTPPPTHAPAVCLLDGGVILNPWFGPPLIPPTVTGSTHPGRWPMFRPRAPPHMGRRWQV